MTGTVVCVHAAHACDLLTFVTMLLLLLYTRLKAVLSYCEDVAKDNLARTIGTGDPMHKVCISHTVYLAHGNRKDEARGRNTEE